MAGHRRKDDGKLRSENRNQVWRGRLSCAPTAEAQFDVAADWFRSSCKHFPDPAEQERLLDEAARYLADRADELDHKLIAAAHPGRRTGVYR